MSTRTDREEPIVRAASLKLLAVVVIGCIGVGGLHAATGAARPAVQTAANLANSVKKALKLGKSADRKSSNALATARRAEKAVVAGRQGPAGPAGPQAPAGSNGSNGSNGSDGSNGSNGSNGSAGATGPTGAAGATGSTGATGAPATTGLWEVFEAPTGAPVHKRGTATGGGHLGNGIFYVSFAPKDITGCAYIASVGSISDGTPPALYATVEQRTGTPTDLRVRAFNDVGGLTDPGSGNGFHVAVFC
jgi:Collagen triple helix repeat (20 copies)